MTQESLIREHTGIGHEIGALESWCRETGLRWIVGVDEAGRGPLAGPVHTAAVAVDLEEAAETSWYDRVDDSKSLDEASRVELFEHLRDVVAHRAVESADASEIDEFNIREATRRAMERAVERATDSFGDVDAIFVDGDMELAIAGRQRAIVEGDGRSRVIAAASILAKVSRDRHMREAADRWPVYGFDSNVGYPTPDHRRALDEHGPCPIHRRSFSGVESTETSDG